MRDAGALAEGAQLVTGGLGGLGLIAARQLAELGVKVVEDGCFSKKVTHVITSAGPPASPRVPYDGRRTTPYTRGARTKTPRAW